MSSPQVHSLVKGGLNWHSCSNLMTPHMHSCSHFTVLLSSVQVDDQMLNRQAELVSESVTAQTKACAQSLCIREVGGGTIKARDVASMEKQFPVNQAGCEPVRQRSFTTSDPTLLHEPTEAKSLTEREPEFWAIREPRWLRSRSIEQFGALSCTTACGQCCTSAKMVENYLVSWESST